MATELSNEASAAEPEGVLPPEGHKAGVPYDLRRPTKARFKARMWNGNDPHMFPPKSFGAGWTINFYWLFHLTRYMKGRRART
jgi:hypothetical protein